MSDLREASQQALDALHEICWSNNTQWQADRAADILPILRDALTEPTVPSDCPYSHQPQRKPLTDQEIDNLRHLIDPTADWSYFAFARAIEKAHGIGSKDE